MPCSCSSQLRACLKDWTSAGARKFPPSAVIERFTTRAPAVTPAKLADGLRCWRNRRRKDRRRWRRWIHHARQVRITPGEKINRIRRKENNHGNRNQRHRIKHYEQKNTAGNDSRRYGEDVPGKACSFAGDHRDRANSSEGNQKQDDNNERNDPNPDRRTYS